MRLRPAVAAVTTAVTAATCLTAVASPASAHPAPRACSPSARVTGYSDALDKTTFRGAYVGNLSALAVDTNGRLTALSDRSKLFTLDRHARPASVVSFADETGQQLDSEGLAIQRDGTRLITSETEPSVRRYDRRGRLLERLPVPGALQTHKVSNRTFEGLTLDDHGNTLIASMEGWLTTDGTDTRRIQTWRRGHRGDFRLGRQFAYMGDTGYGIAEIEAIGDGRLLVLERSFASSVGWTAHLYVADPRSATNVSGITGLANLASGVRFASKTLIARLEDCPPLGAPSKVEGQANPLLGNIEGMAITGLRRGGLHLTLVTDDGESTTEITRLYGLDVRLPRR
ncbi:esterase-like activity of phytase family protein [Streptomyces javensis]|uniref:Esterase-like activity of phytase family protein n=1 Tax=Streptomyces javensis TaxID=114698 RepID=A0ABS0R6S6_9ACTN|nr:esterase-like activity of phytase family protein [Streptomyces javensis]